TIVLPPADRHDRVATVLADATTGLPSGQDFKTDEYKSSLALEYVAPPTLAAGVDRFGTHVGGGTALVFGDLLENHNLITGFQVNGSLRDIFALVGYQNQSHRLNWGIAGQQVPFLGGSYREGLTTLNGQTVFAQQVQLDRQTNRTASFFTAYPFNRAQRVELG